MCRNIKTLFNFEPPVTEDEIRAASLQFVRKVSGFNQPAKANEVAFLAAVDEIASPVRCSTRSRRTCRRRTAPQRRPRGEYVLGGLRRSLQNNSAPIDK
jgi:hypothetical protein